MGIFVTYLGFSISNMMWKDFETYQITGKEFTLKDGYKYFAMSFVLGTTAMITGFLSGDISCVLGFFDNYNTGIEGTANNATEADKDGNSLMEDFFVGPFVYIAMYIAIFFSIVVGGANFTLMGLGHTWAESLP
jgi:hypothetical protein